MVDMGNRIALTSLCPIEKWPDPTSRITNDQKARMLSCRVFCRQGVPRAIIPGCPASRPADRPSTIVSNTTGGRTIASKDGDRWS